MMPLKRFIQSMLVHEEGSVLIMTGATILLLVAIAGAGVDFGYQQLVRSKLQQASDAATIAASTLPDDPTIAEQEAAARRYFALNFPDTYMGVPRPAPTVTVNAGGIVVEATATIQTRFVKFLGPKMSQMKSTGRSVVSSITTKSGASSYDIILSMDVSGSMRCSANSTCPNMTGQPRFIALRNAADAISSNLLSNNTSNSRIAANTWDGSLRQHIDFQSTYPPIQNFLMQHVGAFGGTCALRGLERAQQQAAGFRPNVVRALVLLTDGVDGCDLNQKLALCDAFKNQGVVVYTIALGQDVSSGPWAPTVRQFLSSCASGTPATNLGQYFFIAPDGATLQQVFQSILTSVKSLRITE